MWVGLGFVLFVFDLFRLVHGLTSCLNSCWVFDVSVLNVALDLGFAVLLYFCVGLNVISVV